MLLTGGLAFTQLCAALSPRRLHFRLKAGVIKEQVWVRGPSLHGTHTVVPSVSGCLHACSLAFVSCLGVADSLGVRAFL